MVNSGYLATRNLRSWVLNVSSRSLWNLLRACSAGFNVGGLCRGGDVMLWFSLSCTSQLSCLIIFILLQKMLVREWWAFLYKSFAIGKSVISWLKIFHCFLFYRLFYNRKCVVWLAIITLQVNTTSCPRGCPFCAACMLPYSLYCCEYFKQLWNWLGASFDFFNPRFTVFSQLNLCSQGIIFPYHSFFYIYMNNILMRTTAGTLELGVHFCTFAFYTVAAASVHDITNLNFQTWKWYFTWLEFFSQVQIVVWCDDTF